MEIETSGFTSRGDTENGGKNKGSGCSGPLADRGARGARLISIDSAVMTSSNSRRATPGFPMQPGARDRRAVWSDNVGTAGGWASFVVLSDEAQCCEGIRATRQPGAWVRGLWEFPGFAAPPGGTLQFQGGTILIA